MTVPRDARRDLRSATPNDPAQDTSVSERLRDLSAQIVEVATDAIISKDRDGVITSWNLGAERLYGYTAQEAVGIPISFLIPKELKGEEHRLWRSFGQMTVAERVEDARTLERLRELEVDYVQGYYLGRPQIVEVD